MEKQREQDRADLEMKRLCGVFGSPQPLSLIHIYQLHGDFHSLYDQGVADGGAVPLLRDERPFPQCHHG